VGSKAPQADGNGYEARYPSPGTEGVIEKRPNDSIVFLCSATQACRTMPEHPRSTIRHFSPHNVSFILRDLSGSLT